MFCGFGRIAIWQELKGETGTAVASMLNELFLERGPFKEVLINNRTVFKSTLVKALLDKLNVQAYYRVAYRPSGNGIVGRHHRIVKAIAKRGQISPIEAIYWYNMSLWVSQEEDSVQYFSTCGGTH